MAEFLELRGRLFNTSLMITPAKARVLADVLGDRATWGTAINFIGQAADGPQMEVSGAGPSGPEKLFPETDGIAVIDIRGTLVQRNGLDPFSGMTGYDGIAAKLDAAVNDPTIRAIVFDIDSPGGEVAGCFDLADLVYAARDAKPVWAILSEMACSAAFAIASQADRVIVPRTGYVGSVGVVTMHVDWSSAMEKAGGKVTLIHGGATKVDGNPYEPLPDDVRETIQVEIDTLHDMFAQLVARGRGISVGDVMSTEARTYLGPDAVKTGFADAVMAPEEGFQALLAALAGEPVTITG